MENLQKFYINGKWIIPNSTKTMAVLNPATEDLIGEIILGNSEDVDMDMYSTEAMKSYKDLMDLGMNVEARHAGDIFAAAQRMLKNAIEAKTSKTEKKLKMIELQLKKLKLDQDNKTSDDTIKGEGYVIADRNDILKSFIDKENE